MPVRSPLWRREEDIRQVIGQEVSAVLHAYRAGDEVVIPHRSHLVQAQVA
jgi:hypothetical protein